MPSDESWDMLASLGQIFSKGEADQFKNEQNYYICLIWMKNVFKSHEMWHIVDGTETIPPNACIRFRSRRTTSWKPWWCNFSRLTFLTVDISLGHLRNKLLLHYLLERNRQSCESMCLLTRIYQISSLKDFMHHMLVHLEWAWGPMLVAGDC